MNCPYCKIKLKCIDSRASGDFLRFRIYKCENCAFTDVTEERLLVDENVETEPEKILQKWQVMTYFVSCGEEIKIGKSVDYLIKRRISQLQTGNPHKIILVCKIECDCEKEFHNLFDEYKMRGEWYHLPEDYIETVKLYCDKNKYVHNI